MAKQKSVTITNAKVLQAIEEALGGLGDGVNLKITRIALAPPPDKDCKEGYEWKEKMGPSGVEWYCAKKKKS